MPGQNFNVSLAAIGAIEIVDNAKRITGVTVTFLTPGANFRMKLGNGPALGRFFADGVLKMIGSLDPRDTNEGLSIVSDTAQAGATVEGFVSYEVAGHDGSITYETG